MYEKIIKRAFDFIIALLMSPIVFLVIIVMAPFIYLSDPGPIFYNAPRLGKDGKQFKMFKLRSMYVNSPDIRNADGSTFNSNNDSRVTKIGKIMRKTSVDEIPQIINVLIGDMSFVGPRPTISTKPFDEIPAINKKRYNVRPGITGYSQAYYRNSIGQDEKFKQDNYYVDNVSLFLDIKILIKTVVSVLKRDNIYVENTSEKKEKVTNK